MNYMNKLKSSKMQKLIALSLLYFIVSPQSCLFAQSADCCDREAILYCEYNHSFMGNAEREKIEKEFTGAVFGKFQEIFNRDCFQVLLPAPLDASNIPQNEYQIEVKHTQVTNLTKWPNTRIEAELFLVVEGYRESVHYWEVEEAGDSLTADNISWPSFLDKLVNKIRNGPEITELVEKCEKRPVTLEVGCDKEEFNPGEVISVFVFDFKDKYGEDSREFNRIVVQVSSGEIINGATCDLGPDYYAFRTERGLIELKYRAPENCVNPTVKFTVYNSCDILREQDLWMSKTQTKDPLVEKDFAMNCYDAAITVTGKYDKILTTSREDSKNGEVQKHYIKESIEASAIVFLTMTESQDMPIFNQTWQYYTPTSVNLSGFSYNSEENRYSAGPKYETTVDFHRNVTHFELEGIEYVGQLPWMLVIDNETEKAVKFIPAGFNVAYEINETENINSVIYSDDGPERDSQTLTKTYERSFALGPVAEEIPDPTIKSSSTWIRDYIKDQGIDIPAGVPVPNVSNEETIKEIHPDILVKHGDGKTSFGGDGSRRIRKDLEDGYEEENLSYNWQMTIKKKE